VTDEPNDVATSGEADPENAVVKPVTIVFNNPIQWGIVAATGALCAMLLLSGILRDPRTANPINGILILALILLSWYGFSQFRDRRPQVQIDDTGIRIRTLDDLLLTWPEIAAVRLVPRGLLGLGGGQRLSEIQIAVRDFKGLTGKLGPADRARLFFKGLRLTRIVINLRTMIYDKAALEFVLRTYLPQSPPSAR
jgi:hypothetical protein